LLNSDTPPKTSDLVTVEYSNVDRPPRLCLMTTGAGLPIQARDGFTKKNKARQEVE
jgi:hypothetical protein